MKLPAALYFGILFAALAAAGATAGEAEEADVAAASAVIERVMAGAAEPAVSLDVPLGVDIGTGTSWGAAH